MNFRMTGKSIPKVKKIVKGIVDESKQGDSPDVYENAKVFVNLLEDRLYKYPNERNRLKIAVEENLHKKIRYEMQPNDTRRLDVYVEMLAEKYSIVRSAAEEIIDILHYAVFGMSVERKTSNLQKSKSGKIVLGFSFAIVSVVFFSALYMVLKLIMKIPGAGCLYGVVGSVAYFLIKDLLFYKKNKDAKNLKAEVLGKKNSVPVRLVNFLMEILICCVVISYCMLF